MGDDANMEETYHSVVLSLFSLLTSPLLTHWATEPSQHLLGGLLKASIIYVTCCTLCRFVGLSILRGRTDADLLFWRERDLVDSFEVHVKTVCTCIASYGGRCCSVYASWCLSDCVCLSHSILFFHSCLLHLLHHSFSFALSLPLSLCRPPLQVHLSNCSHLLRFLAMMWTAPVTTCDPPNPGCVSVATQASSLAVFSSYLKCLSSESLLALTTHLCPGRPARQQFSL